MEILPYQTTNTLTRTVRFPI